MGANQQYNLRWNDFHTTLASSFSLLRNDSDFIDVTLACDGQSFNAHKVVISACSVYLKKLLKTNPCQHPIVILRDVKASILNSLLHFMYHGAVDISQSQLSDFLQAAQMLEIKGLSEDQGIGNPKDILGSSESFNRRLSVESSIPSKSGVSAPPNKRVKLSEIRSLNNEMSISRSHSDFIEELSPHTELDNESDSSQLDSSAAMSYVGSVLTPDVTVSPVEKLTDKNAPCKGDSNTEVTNVNDPMVELKEEGDQSFSGFMKQEPIEDSSFSNEYNEDSSPVDLEKRAGNYGETGLPTYNNSGLYMSPSVSSLPGPGPGQAPGTSQGPGPSSQEDNASGGYNCPVCNKHFVVKQYMKHHLKYVHERKPVHEWDQCHICCKYYRNKKSVIDHLNKCHGVFRRNRGCRFRQNFRRGDDGGEVT